jgi:hypothetical protein
MINPFRLSAPKLKAIFVFEFPRQNSDTKFALVFCVDEVQVADTYGEAFSEMIDRRAKHEDRADIFPQARHIQKPVLQCHQPEPGHFRRKPLPFSNRVGSKGHK